MGKKDKGIVRNKRLSQTTFGGRYLPMISIW